MHISAKTIWLVAIKFSRRINFFDKPLFSQTWAISICKSKTVNFYLFINYYFKYFLFYDLKMNLLLINKLI